MWRWWLFTTTFESGGDCHHHFFKVEFAIFQAILSFTILFFATRSVLWPKICRKCNSCRGCAPDPAGRAHDAPPDLLYSRLGSGHPSPYPTHSASLAPRCSRLRRLDRRAPWHQILATPLVTTTFKVKLRQCLKLWTYKSYGSTQIQLYTMSQKTRHQTFIVHNFTKY